MEFPRAVHQLPHVTSRTIQYGSLVSHVDPFPIYLECNVAELLAGCRTIDKLKRVIQGGLLDLAVDFPADLEQKVRREVCNTWHDPRSGRVAGKKGYLAGNMEVIVRLTSA